MLKIITIPVGQMQSNCYLVIDELTSKGIIIDPGDDWDYLISKIQEMNIILEKIIVTHGHFDHIMGVFSIQQILKTPFFLHKEDEFLLNNMQSSARHFLNIEAGPSPSPDNYLKDKEIIKLGQNKFEVIHTPGHTPGSVCLYNKKEKILFTGDLIFADGGVGRTDFSYSNTLDMEQSITKIFKLPKETIIYPGHGLSTTVGIELKIRNY